MTKFLRAAIAEKTAEAAQHLADALLEETLADPRRAQQSALYHRGEPGVFFTLQQPPGEKGDHDV